MSICKYRTKCAQAQMPGTLNIYLGLIRPGLPLEEETASVFSAARICIRGKALPGARLRVNISQCLPWKCHEALRKCRYYFGETRISFTEGQLCFQTTHTVSLNDSHLSLSVPSLAFRVITNVRLAERDPLTAGVT